MQKTHDFFLDTYSALTQNDLGKIIFPLSLWDRIFLDGDLWSGKSTLVRALLQDHFHDPSLIVRSPTYTYYQKYSQMVSQSDGQIVGSSDPAIYHFDLYRVESFDDLLLLWAIDILEDPSSICLIEWPEILWDQIQPTKTITIKEDSSNTWWRNYTIKTIKR